MRKWSTDCVPIVQQDLSHEETLIQIAFALDSLETVASNVFRHVHSNLERGKSRLDKLQRRCTVVEARVKKITGISKSLKVVSTNKYPVHDQDSFKYTHEPAVIYKNDEGIICRPLSPDKMNLREKLKFFHVKDSLETNSRDYERYPEEGLGDVPRHVKSISSLFLFNTSDNLYRKYKITDPLAHSSKKQNVLKEVYKDKLVEPAPKSLDSHFDWMNYRYDQDYFYSPVQNDVPDIEAPMDLPDLPGIAGDLQFSVEKIETIKSEKSSVDKESLVIDESKPSENNSLNLTDSDENKSVFQNKESFSEITSTEQKIVESACKTEEVTVPIPPPPPAPPAPPPIVDITPQTSSTNVSENLHQPDLRAHLMEAIRKAGGVSTLKPVSRKSEEVKPMKKSTGNSMMDELHDKLSWRRKGISGKFDSDTNIMDRIVSMIPPPPSKPPDPDSDKEWDD